MSTIRVRHIVGALLLGAVVAGGALEIALARSGAHDGTTDGRWLRLPPRDTGWQAHVAAVDRALADGDATRAVLAWHDAYGAALASGRWEALVEVGDAFVRIGAGTSAAGSRANARLAYLAALTRAQQQRSAEGVRRVARAFEALGDHAVAAQCARIAARLPSGEARGRGRLAG